MTTIDVMCVAAVALVGGGPLAKLGAAYSFDAVADGQDDFEAV